MSSGIILIIFFAIMLAAIFNGTPVFTALGFTAVAGIVIWVGAKQLGQMGVIAYTNTTNYNLIILPMFIMLSEFLTRGKIAEDIYTVLNKAVGRYKGGLAIATTLACTIFAALCGSSPATAASIGRISIDEMVKRGYSPDFAVGTVAAGGTLGIMIPPSVTFCIFAILTENSIVRLFMAGIIPGIMLAALIIISIKIRTKLNPNLINYKIPEGKTMYGADMTLEEAQDIVKTAKLTSRAEIGGIEEEDIIADSPVVAEVEEKSPSFLTILPACVLILLVLGSMYFGWATPFEAAGYGVIGAFVILVVKRRMTKSIFSSALLNSARTGCMMMFLVICGMSMTFVVSYLGLPQEISAAIAESGLNKYVVLIMVYILWLILGALMEPTSMVLLTIPFLYSTLVGMGFEPMWIGVVLVVGSQIAMITPPVGLNLFVLKANTTIPMRLIIKGSLPYVGVLLIGLAILTVFPGLATFLPSRMF